jgi:hypothetical protein
MSGSPSKEQVIQEYQTLASNLASVAPNGVFPYGGQSYTTQQIGVLIAQFLKTATAVASARTAWIEAAQVQEQVEATSGKVLDGIREVIGLAYANSPTTLQTLGITPRKKPAPLSVEALAAAKAKAAATRKARGTTSKKQKALITGDVTGVSITPTTTTGGAPAATAGTSAPVVPPAAQAVNGAKTS